MYGDSCIYHGEHFIMYGIVNSLCCILETNIIYNHIMISVNYTSVSKKSKRKGKEKEGHGREGRKEGELLYTKQK